MQKNLTRALSRGSLLQESKTWPSLAEVSVLRLVGLIWSTSDLSNPVAAPALLYICQVLDQARVRDERDLASGLMCAALCLQVRSHSIEPWI